MAEQLGNAFIYMGFSVTYYDIEKGLSSITDLIGEKYVAIIGFQTKIFEIYLQSKNCYLHDLIEGPKFNFCFDHPIWLSRQLKNVPLNYYVQNVCPGMSSIIFGEQLVFAVEAVCYRFVTGNWRTALIYSALCNAVSFSMGVLMLCTYELITIPKCRL